MFLTERHRYEDDAWSVVWVTGWRLLVQGAALSNELKALIFCQSDVPGAVPSIDIAGRCHDRGQMGRGGIDLEEHNRPPVNLRNTYPGRPFAK